MKASPFVVLSGKFSMELTPLSNGQVSSQITSEGFNTNALGLGIAIGQLIGWFLDGCEKNLAATPGLELDTIEKRIAFNHGMMAEINLGITRSLHASIPIPPKEKQQ